MTPPCRRRDDEQHPLALLLAAIERAAGDAGELVAGGNPDLELRRFALHDGQVDEREEAKIGIADGDERFHVGEQPCVAWRGRRSGLSRRPPDLRRRSRIERRLDDGAAAGRRPPEHQTRRDAKVRLLAGNVEGRRHAPGGRHRQHERSPSGAGRDRRSPFERGREGRRTGDERDMRVAFGDERQRTIGRPRVEERRVLDERNLHGSCLEHLAIHRHRRAHGPGGDAGADVGAGERRGQRRAVRRAGLPAGEIEQPVVVGARQRDGAGRPALLRERARGREGRAGESRSAVSVVVFVMLVMFAMAHLWLRRLYWTSSAGAYASAVSSAATKNDGPMSGTVTWTGMAPADVRPMSLRNRSTSALALAASRSPPAWASAAAAGGAGGAPARQPRCCEARRSRAPAGTRRGRRQAWVRPGSAASS